MCITILWFIDPICNLKYWKNTPKTFKSFAFSIMIFNLFQLNKIINTETRIKLTAYEKGLT